MYSDCEREFNTINLIKYKHRNKLNVDHLNDSMRNQIDSTIEYICIDVVYKNGSMKNRERNAMLHFLWFAVII